VLVPSAAYVEKEKVHLRLYSAFIHQATSGIVERNPFSAQCWKVLSDLLDIVRDCAVCFATIYMAGDSGRHDGEGLF
jgi:hypothetical protein